MKRSSIAKLISRMVLISSAVFAVDCFAAPKTYKGVATPVITTTIRFGYNDAFRGIITYVARPGMILRGPVYDMHNNVVEKGDLLIQMRKDYRQSVVEGKVAILKSALANLKNAQENYVRFKDLIKKNATSMETFQQAEANYLAAIGTKESAESDVELAKVMLEACTFHSPFDALVEEVYFPAGLCAGELDIVKISQLFPMGIKVKMDREAARKITMETPIAVYPCNSDKPVGTFHRASYLLPDGIMLKVNNSPVAPPVKLKKNGKTIPTCRASVSTPYVFYHGKKKSYITVPMSSIYKDDKGYYVWRAVNQREIQVKGISPIVTIEKIRVVPGELKMAVDANTNFRVLNDSGPLKVFDVVLTHVKEKLRSGQEVCIWPFRYMFMPGDPVKVVIGK